MNNLAEKVLYRKAALIFEELGFLMPQPDNGGGDSSDAVSAVVSFNGPFDGCLLVSLSSGILPRLSSNMLGSEGSSGRTLDQDALCEVANVICGNALPAIYGFDPIFHLDAPKLVDASSSADLESTFNRSAEIHINFEGGRADVTLFVDKSQPAASSQ
jgi:chemotaxis protein CheY-P-specific phosphatase CheC